MRSGYRSAVESRISGKRIGWLACGHAPRDVSRVCVTRVRGPSDVSLSSNASPYINAVVRAKLPGVNLTGLSFNGSAGFAAHPLKPLRYSAEIIRRRQFRPFSRLDAIQLFKPFEFIAHCGLVSLIRGIPQRQAQKHFA